ncbi:MAG: nucleoside-diphosphate kinase [Arsenophonus sp.]|nr:MAG: nucleoside-diphosphate kinase [Arsenophonus sp.]
MIEYTLSIIKPNIIKKNMLGSICLRLETARFKIIAAKMIKLDYQDASVFYYEHKNKDYFKKLINFMISGPIMLQVLKSKNAIKKFRDLIGNTNPKNALTGTIRSDYGDSLTENAIHGSDSLTSAKREISFFFKKNELFDQ